MQIRIRKRKGTSHFHYSFTHNGVRFRGSTGESERGPAAKAARGIGDGVEANGGKPRRLTLLQASTRYADEYAVFLASGDTIAGHLARLQAGLNPEADLMSIEDPEIATYVATRRASVSNATVNRELATLRALLRRAEKQWKIEVGPAREWGQHRLAEPKERRRYLSEDEKIAILDAIRPDLRPLVQFCLLTGARLGSAINLGWKDIDYRIRRMRLKVKGGGTLDLPMTDAHIALIANEKGKHPDRVFTFTVAKKRGPRQIGEYRPLTQSGWRKPWAAALKAAGVTDFRFHDLRHTAATDMLHRTKNLAVVQKVLGHASIATTNRYAHVLNEDMLAALETLSAPIGAEIGATVGTEAAKTLKKAG